MCNYKARLHLTKGTILRAYDLGPTRIRKNGVKLFATFAGPQPGGVSFPR
jgi:hypothetical protein